MFRFLRYSGYVLIIMVLFAGCGRTALERSQPADSNFVTDGGTTASDAGTQDDGIANNGAADVDVPIDNRDAGLPGPCAEEASPMPEICGNDVDEDCDGVADDGCSCDYEGDSDGVCQNGTISESDGSCLQPDSYENPEMLCDGRDNDCNGLTDENCTCVEGETQPCYNGPAGTETEGACQPGVLECEGNTFSGVCSGEITPEEEQCNSVDDDCDGVIDEGCSCTHQDKNEGVCADAILDEFGNCPAPAGYQDTEVSCDGLDNDCDGVVDEDCSCDFSGVSTGVCGNGVVSEADGSCTAPPDYETEESICDGKDNDCDGRSDENCMCAEGESRSCYDGPDGTAGVGQCEAGQQTCMDGFYGGDCDGQVTPGTETCNGVDDDCDGVTDEGCACEYLGESAGVCSSGLTDATGGCTEPASYESDETTCDGLDNDCDGVVDEGCNCNYQGTGAGVCSDGTIDDSGACTAPSTFEATETLCDGLDNDCDGPVDEGCPCNFRDSDQGVCGDAVRNDGGQCKPPMGFTGNEARCDDGIDNDCDGLTDCDDQACSARPTCN